MALKLRGVRWCAVAGCGCCGCLARCVRAAGALGLADAAVESSERLAALLVRVSPCKAWWTSLSPERFWARLGGRKMQAWAASVEVWRRGKTSAVREGSARGDAAERQRHNWHKRRRIEFATGRRAKGEASWQSI
ncbi:hypothetical protein M431DRAFT_480242 [Trichoderma harzianum CBS 226.95]|uniref:Uncharacterized protein n=1 Tax=Trichoderma harzianum CBS 226.95 TaxID=983964 RepID=A0A2T4AHN6_TRIHA|nr:hypothetical protein M431DRAFT_480242 [Trichoderma harzianum CBS 226.95]PTB56579.1 hypothetical protein M431DRAFT_480242 [Trichoderma harzianum CBS 226.95]